MKEGINEDVCLDFTGHPFIKCWESVIPNLWYSDNSESAFMLTFSGFRLCPRAKTKQQYLRWLIGGNKSRIELVENENTKKQHTEQF